MQSLTSALTEYLDRALSERLTRTPDGRVQPVLVGPPAETLSQLFDTLTGGTGAELRLQGAPGAPPVVVLLVQPGAERTRTDPVPTVTPRRLSQRCGWDYAVSVRNSGTPTITMAPTEAWHNRPESIANATETIGGVELSRRRRSRKSGLWQYLMAAVAANLSLPESLVDQAFALFSQHISGVDAQTRDALPWRAVDELLAASAPEDLLLVLGLPAVGSEALSSDSLAASADVLDDLARFCGTNGLREAERLLRAGAVPLVRRDPGMRPLAAPLRSMFRHVSEGAAVGASFQRGPARFFRPEPGDTGWWSDLPYRKLRAVLDAVGASTPTGKLVVRTPGALNPRERAGDEPYVFADHVRIEAVDEDTGAPLPIDVSRRPTRQAETRFQAPAGVPMDDDTVPEHDRPITYTVGSSDRRPVAIKVVSLASFRCRGYARIRDAVSNPPPAPRGAPGSFEQEITLSRSGPHQLVIHADPLAASVILAPIDQGQASHTFTANPVTTPIVVEDRDEFEISVVGAGGELLGRWTLRTLVQEPTAGVARNRYEALVTAHQSNRTRTASVVPGAAPVRALEDAYLGEADSWLPKVACWSAAETVFATRDWSSATLGDVQVFADVRPPAGNMAPPAQYLARRALVREALINLGTTVGEAVLDEPTLAALVETYILEYIDWLGSDPEAAVWSDCVAVYAATRNVQAGQDTAGGEPIALLLSPLHPLRLAWHCNAQRVLADALETKSCPAAGLLNAHGSPGVVGLPLYRGGTLVRWRAFLASGSTEPHWSLLWNAEHLGETTEKAAATAVLEALGVAPTGVTGGFTRSQAVRALREVAGILPARAVLRVGLIGHGQESSGCVEGLLDWCREAFGGDEEGAGTDYPTACEIHDLRDDPSFPTAAGLASLSEETAERVRWFAKGSAAAPASLDIIILDQVGTLQPTGVASAARSPLSSGALFRVNIREDAGNAQVLQEARIGRGGGQQAGLDGSISRATGALEKLAAQHAGTSHFQFEPNQQAIALRLGQSLFVAATSSQIDPACFIRGASANRGYLWDYEVPGTIGVNEDRAGYYLVARPSQSMKDAITSTARLVTANPPPVDDLISEISSRGIPILKRMASGGGHARGELGVLLAVHLLQDMFRAPNSGVRLPVRHGDCVHLLLPVDSYWPPIDQVRRRLLPGTSAEHPDLVVFSILRAGAESVHVKATPLEIKFRGDSAMTPAEIRAALDQAGNLGRILDALWVQQPPNELWATCGRAILAHCLDQCFRIYADERIHGGTREDWTQFHELTLRCVLGAPDLADVVTVNRAGRLAVFDRSMRSSVVDMDGDLRSDTVIVCPADSEVLLTGLGTLTPPADGCAVALDLAFPGCRERDGSVTGGSDERDRADMPPPPGTGAGPEAPAASLTAGDSRLRAEALPSEPRGDMGPGEPRPAETTSLPTASTTTPDDGSRPAPSPVPSEIRAHVQQVFDGFVGNAAAVKRLSNDLLRALIEKPPHLAKNYLFTGQPSTGKTELARRMAMALQLPFVRLDGRGVSSRARLFELVDGELNQQGLPPSTVGQQAGLPVLEYPPHVVFIDEVHLVPRGVQESLLTMLEAADRTVTLTDRVAKVAHTTFLFATTRASDVDAAFRSRCTEIQLREYTLSEVAEIVARRFPHDSWPADTYERIAQLGRGVPRVAIELARELETWITVSEHGESSPAEHLDELRRAMEIDDLGLTPTDLEYLDILERQGAPVGELALLRMMQTVDRDRIVDEIEPFLRNLGFIRFGPRGRELTPEGREYLLGRRRHGP